MHTSISSGTCYPDRKWLADDRFGVKIFHGTVVNQKSYNYLLGRKRTMAHPETVVDLVAVLRALSERMPTTPAELSKLEQESLALALHLQKSQIVDSVPEIVWHFLSDPDIRFKSPEYAQVQVSALASALVTMELQGAV